MIPGLLALTAFVSWLIGRQPAFLIVASIFVACAILLFGIGLLAYLRKREVRRHRGFRAAGLKRYRARSTGR